MLETAANAVELSPSLTGSLDMQIGERDGEYFVRVGYKHRSGCEPLSNVGFLAEMKEMLARTGARMAYSTAADGNDVLTLYFPACSGD
jgi:hypothetical protein